MIVETVLGNVHDDPTLLTGRHVERVLLGGDEAVRRLQRLRTDHGRELGLRLPAGSPELRDGDVLALEDDPAGGSGTAVVAALAPQAVVVIAPRGVHEMGVVAHTLGNRHLPAQFFPAGDEYDTDVMVVQDDPTVIDLLTAGGVPHERRSQVMPTAFRHADHRHT